MKGRLVPVAIDELAYGGDGVGSVLLPGDPLYGIRCFVPFTAPGDRLTARIEKASRRFLKASMVSIQEASPLRRQPVCPHFGECGGCQWQHILYETQLEAKENALRQTLRRIAGFDLGPGRIEAVPSPLEYGYRSRVRFHVSDRGTPAFLAAGSGRMVEIHDCPVLAEPLRRLASDNRGGFFPRPPGSQISFQLLLDGTLLHAAAGEAEIGFRQANGGINELLKRRVVLAAGKKSAASGALDGLRVLDLYCGNGNLSLPLLEGGAEVRGYDISRPSIEEANRAAGGKGYRLMDAPSAAEKIASGALRPFGGPPPDIILLDPPRAGAGERAMRAVFSIGAGSVVCLSCDPSTLARDLAGAREAGYVITEACAADMFPQTYHLESLIILEKEER